MSDVVSLKPVRAGMPEAHREELASWLDLVKEQVLAGEVAALGLVVAAPDGQLSMRTCADSRLHALGMLEALKMDMWGDD